jgi:hypothetical protein
MKKKDLKLAFDPDTMPKSGELKLEPEDQPIKPEVLRSIWVEHLENRDARLDFVETYNAEKAKLAERENRTSDRIESVFRHAKIDPKEWDVDFRRGTMKRKAAPAPPTAPPA